MAALSGLQKEVLSVYRQLLRASQQFTNYYFREYSIRRTREDFRANRSVSDAQRITQLLDYARRNLDIIKRQALIGRLYGHQDLVIEAKKPAATAASSLKTAG